MQDRQLQETHALWHEIHRLAHYLNETRTRLTALEQKMNTNNAQEIKKLKDEMMQEIRDLADTAGFEKQHGFWFEKADRDKIVGQKEDHQTDKMHDVVMLRGAPLPKHDPLPNNHAYV